MAISTGYPQITIFDVTKVHTDGRYITLDGPLGHQLTIVCFGPSGNHEGLFHLYQHEPEAVAGADVLEGDDDRIPF